MKITIRYLVILLIAVPGVFAAKKKGATYIDPVKAAAEDPDFSVQGEYLGDGIGAQVVALGDGKFQGRLYHGGLPGKGWKTGDKVVDLAGERSASGLKLVATKVSVPYSLDISGDTAVLSYADSAHLKKVRRQSPSLGAKPPAGAVVLFDGTTNNMNGKVYGPLLAEGAASRDSFGSFNLHLEFRTPYKPFSTPGSQDRGNSGVYTFNRYETQVLDSFGIEPKNNFCGGLYKFKVPDLNMCFPPLTWQTYDIDFTAPAFKEGKKVRNARITVRHNGVVIHDDVELPKGTGAGGGRTEIPRGQIFLQGHGNPVRFQNIWIVEKQN